MIEQNSSVPIDEGPDSRTQANAFSTLPAELKPEMLRMVRALAARLHSRLPQGCGLEMGDLIQAGNVGLLKAVQAFEAELGAPVLSYAKFRVRGEMLDLVRRHLGREGNASGPGLLPGTSASHLEDHLRATAACSPQAPLFTRQRAEIIQAEVERLPARYRAVMRLRYAGEMTLREIGVALRVKESRACQLHTKALIQLKKALNSRGVSGFSQL
jgi:RNA polymerase sigma factor for flagellar operon FliA